MQNPEQFLFNSISKLYFYYPPSPNQCMIFSTKKVILFRNRQRRPNNGGEKNQKKTRKRQSVSVFCVCDFFLQKAIFVQTRLKRPNNSLMLVCVFFLLPLLILCKRLLQTSKNGAATLMGKPKQIKRSDLEPMTRFSLSVGKNCNFFFFLFFS